VLTGFLAGIVALTFLPTTSFLAVAAAAPFLMAPKLLLGLTFLTGYGYFLAPIPLAAFGLNLFAPYVVFGLIFLAPAVVTPGGGDFLFYAFIFASIFAYYLPSSLFYSSLLFSPSRVIPAFFILSGCTLIKSLIQPTSLQS
jgi:hypothetical protein